MEFPPRGNGGGNASKGLRSRTRASVVAQPLASKEVYSYSVYTILIFASLHFSVISALQAFNVSSTSYDCLSNMICLEDAHVYTAQNNTWSNGIQVGSLSLIHEGYPRNLGVAYYKESIQLLDRSTQQMASFNTSFVIDTVWDTANVFGVAIRGGDGMAFVISADNISTGEAGGSFGIFDDRGLTQFKSIVVEFDSYSNPPVYDINDNHVSIDLANIRASAVANASDVMVDLGGNSTRYAWVEYSKETQQLEVRVSNNGSRPLLPLLNYTLELSGFVEEYMWVGFSSGSSDVVHSNYYVRNWTFESYGILKSTESKSDRVMKLGLILGLSVGLGGFLLVCTVIFLFVQRNSGWRGGPYMNCLLRWTISKEEDMSTPVKGMPERFSYKQLSMATKSFSEESKLGQGAFGSVYLGVLPSSGIPVAVKRLKGESTEGERNFMAEISVISQLRHRNLIQLLGWCKDASRRKYSLVYELMPNGSLDKVLFGPAKQQRPALSWAQRFNIVSGTAAALEYLHQGWSRQVIHRDVKPSNIMLDKDWNAKLGDFGLARLVDHHKEGGTTVVAGTLGYLAPEILVTGKFTDKTDVYAFGVVVLEVACGRKALSLCVPEDEMVLVDWVRRRLNADDLFSTVDKRLENYDTYWMEVLLVIGLQCSHSDPLVRPSMRQVVQVLAGDVLAPLLPDLKPSLLLGNVQSAGTF